MLSGRAFARVPGRLVVQALNVALKATNSSPRSKFVALGWSLPRFSSGCWQILKVECREETSVKWQTTKQQNSTLRRFSSKASQQGIPFSIWGTTFILRVRYIATFKKEKLKSQWTQDPVIEQLSSAGCVAEVLETLSDQEQVRMHLYIQWNHFAGGDPAYYSSSCHHPPSAEACPPCWPGKIKLWLRMEL